MTNDYRPSSLAAGLGIGLAVTAAGLILPSPAGAGYGSCSRCDWSVYNVNSPERMCKWDSDWGGNSCYGGCFYNMYGETICTCNTEGECGSIRGGGSP